jgi:hypothetical protein
MSTKRIAVIGAGPSGITAGKNAIEAGLGAGLVVFEKSDQVGGNWVYRTESGHSSVYSTTHIISSKYHSAYEDYDFPAGTPDYPSHNHLREYFQNYAKDFGVHEKIRFHTEVRSAVKNADQTWTITSVGPDGEKVETFDALMVSNGHHWNPVLPQYPGTFAGEFIHSHAFKNNQPFKDKRVLVIGGGNSAADVAVECSRVATRTCISMRRGHWFMPKFIFGLPGDVVYHQSQWLPPKLRQKALQFINTLMTGKHERYGLQTPDYSILEGHPTLNSELYYFIGHGEVAPKVGISRFDGHTVHFTDGSSEDFDVIIAATGYKITLPFFDKNFINFEHATEVPLWRRMFHKDHPSLYFIGLFQPLGCIWPLADYQAQLACMELIGKYQRPKNLSEEIDKELKNPHFNFYKSHRHATEVDYMMFRKELLAELKKAGVSARQFPQFKQAA